MAKLGEIIGTDKLRLCSMDFVRVAGHPARARRGHSRMHDPTRLLCRLDELPLGGCREFRLGEGDWPLRGFVVRLSDGVRAYVNRCPHLHYPLNYLPDEFLTYDRLLIQCTMHGALFEKESGLCVYGPCLGRSLPSLPVRVDADGVWLAEDADVGALRLRYV